MDISELGVSNAPSSFRVRVTTSEGVPDDLSHCELGNTDFQDKWNILIINVRNTGGFRGSETP